MSSVRLAVPLAVSLMLGCGPSFHAIYEGNARFEHCYGLEENPHSGMTERADCWRDWSERYTYGQTRDRIQYAIARYVALAQAPNIPTDEALMMAAPGMTPRVTTITAPAPTSAYAPPPKVLDEEDAAAPPIRPGERNEILGGPPDAGLIDLAEVDAAVPPSLPGSTCTESCIAAFHQCDAGVACERQYKACMRGCFK